MKTSSLAFLGCSIFALAVSAGATTNLVSGTCVGDVAVICENPAGWKFNVSTAGDALRSVITLHLTRADEALPPRFDVDFTAPGEDATHVWTSSYQAECRLWPELWGRQRYSSQLAYEAPLCVALNENDGSKLAMATSEAFEKVQFGLVANERTCRLLGRFRYFTENTSPRKVYETKILIDRRPLFWGDAVRETSEWIGKTAKLAPAAVPEAARDPLYSTWYAYLQDVHAPDIEAEAARAAKLGMKAMILDDGWQKKESASFYSATGDWMPVPSRFPDMRAHVAAVHRTGLKYMLWLSVPYVGDESEAWKRFSGKFIRMHGAKSPGRIGVLDPRFPEVREYLIRTYERVVRDWGFDGVKLDFIDQFTLPNVDPAAKENYAGRDFKSLPEAVDRLMKDVLARLKAINPEVLVEFRQHYMGPAICQYGNMIRAADCPADPAANRKRIADLRLTSGETAVHADMLVWSPNETPAGAARPILSALFGVIQYSMILKDLPASHGDVIRHWLDFSQRHRATLLKGEFRPHHPELGYPWIEAESAEERIVAAYSDGLALAVGAADKPVIVINASQRAEMVLDLPKAPKSVDAFDSTGRDVACTAPKTAGLVRMTVPTSGYVLIKW